MVESFPSPRVPPPRETFDGFAPRSALPVDEMALSGGNPGLGLHDRRQSLDNYNAGAL
jgi:hypothetical protein